MLSFYFVIPKLKTFTSFKFESVPGVGTLIVEIDESYKNWFLAAVVSNIYK